MLGKISTSHLKKTFLALGLVLLVTTSVTMAGELWVRFATPVPESPRLGSSSPEDAVRLALASLQGTLPVIGALVAVPLFGARLLHELYDIATLKEAHDFLNRICFGRIGKAPKLLAKEGRLASADGSAASRAGGPSSLIVYNDTAVVTEQSARPHRVLGPGPHTLRRYERIWRTVDLRPQRRVREVATLTKEGIPVACDLDICFKIAGSSARGVRVSPGSDRTGVGPYPYTEDAVFRAATGTWIQDSPGSQPSPMSWDDRAVQLAEDALRDILATYRLDWLLRAPQPEQPHPRDQIRDRLEAAVEGDLSTVGAELMEIELGSLQVKVSDRVDTSTEDVSRRLRQLVSQQWIEAWDAGWNARALTSRAEGEAELLRIDAARIQAQAEMVIALAEALQPVLSSGQASEPYVLALRVVEALRWMSYDPDTRDFMPPEAIRTLGRLQKLLDEEGPNSAKTER